MLFNQASIDICPEHHPFLHAVASVFPLCPSVFLFRSLSCLSNRTGIPFHFSQIASSSFVCLCFDFRCRSFRCRQRALTTFILVFFCLCGSPQSGRRRYPGSYTWHVLVRAAELARGGGRGSRCHLLKVPYWALLKLAIRHAGLGLFV